MKNKKSLVAVVALVLVLLIGATIAYFQSSVNFDNIFNTGTYKVVTTEVFESPDNWKPGEEIPKTITTKNEGTIDAAVRVSFTEKWEDSEGNDITSSIDEGTAIINLDNTSEWTKEGNYYYYNYILKPNETTSSFMKSVTLNPDINGVACTGEGNVKTCESSNPTLGAKYILTLTKETVQADKYKDVWNTSLNLKTEKVLIQAIKSGSTLAKGDKVKLKWNDNEEDFKVISVDSRLVGILAENNLNPDTGLQGEAGVMYGVPFSSTQYWAGSFTDMGLVNIYDSTMNAEPGNNNYSVAYYVDMYLKNLRDAGFNINSGRILYQSEIIGSRSFYVDEGESYWLGSVYQIGYNLFLDTQDTNMTATAYSSNNGVRPYIYIYLSDIN